MDAQSHILSLKRTNIPNPNQIDSKIIQDAFYPNPTAFHFLNIIYLFLNKRIFLSKFRKLSFILKLRQLLIKTIL
jgi:hypothetical protein